MACLRILLAGATVLLGALGAQGRQPHLLHIVADDIGWHDLGISNADMRTPHIDSLMRAGVQLTRFYAQKECAPTRSSIMTGRLPFHYGYYENPSDDGGIPTNYTLLAQVLKARGYRTHAIGKWHCGFRTPAHTPTFRGFDSFLGYYHWGEEYVDHVFPPYYKDAKCRGTDLTNATGKSLRPLQSLKGMQSSTIFVDEFERIVQTHPSDVPLYVYLAFQNAHDPYEAAPETLVKKQSARTKDPLRRNFSAIVEDLDIGIGRVVQLLQNAGLWNDTVILFNSDNGGELPFADQSKCNASCLTSGCCGGAGNNYPLRGGKFTLFEGGIRARAFVHGPEPWIPSSRRGTVWSGLSHVSDVFATMASLAGADIAHKQDLIRGGSMVDSVPTDGFDLWKAIVQNEPSPRVELLHQPLNVYWNMSCRASDISNPFTPSCGGSITVWPNKLLVGFPGDTRVVESGSNDLRATPRDLCTAQPCLFNIENDPSESKDLASQFPAVAQYLAARLHALSAPQAAPQPADSLTPAPPDGACAVVNRTGSWQPWQDVGLLHPWVNLV